MARSVDVQPLHTVLLLSAPLLSNLKNEVLRLHAFIFEDDGIVQWLHIVGLLANVRLVRQNVNVKELHAGVTARN